MPAPATAPPNDAAVGATFSAETLWKEAGAPLLLAEDHGPGFDAHRHQDELFQRFRRFHTHPEGTGVGLYLANRRVQGNGGRVAMKSEVGQGTTFRVYLEGGWSRRFMPHSEPKVVIELLFIFPPPISCESHPTSPAGLLVNLLAAASQLQENG
ncbi:MAG: ATP-binding protein [Bacteroidota bacterium]|nr:ATP-binding protein [Bacteroidota bacterium]